MSLIVNCCRLIEQQLQQLLKQNRPTEGGASSIFSSPVGADEFFPVLVHVVLQARAPRALSPCTRAVSHRVAHVGTRQSLRSCGTSHVVATPHQPRGVPASVRGPVEPHTLPFHGTSLPLTSPDSQVT